MVAIGSGAGTGVRSSLGGESAMMAGGVALGAGRLMSVGTEMARGGAATEMSSSVSCMRASWWLSISGGSGDGFCSAWTISRMPARITSFEDASGMRTFVGNQTSMLQIRTARVCTTSKPCRIGRIPTQGPYRIHDAIYEIATMRFQGR